MGGGGRWDDSHGRGRKMGRQPREGDGRWDDSHDRGTVNGTPVTGGGQKMGGSHRRGRKAVVVLHFKISSLSSIHRYQI